MDVKVPSDQLARAIDDACRATDSHPRLPVLAGILIEASDGTLTMTCTDLDLTSVAIEGVDVSQSGRTLVPSRVLQALSKRLGDTVTRLTASGDRLRVAAGSATLELRTMHADDFPSVSQHDPDAVTIRLPVDGLTRAVEQTAHSVSSDQARPVLTGVHVTVADGAATFVSTDSYRLTVTTLQGLDESTSASALIPGQTLAQVVARAGGHEHVDMVVESSQVTFLLPDGGRVTSTLVAGTFPDYTQLLPDEDDVQWVAVDSTELAEAVGRVATVAMQDSVQVPAVLTFTDATLTVSCSSREYGDASDAVVCDHDGDEFTVAVNPSFLAAALAAIGDGLVNVGLVSALRPILLEPAEGSVPQVLLMPVKVT